MLGSSAGAVASYGFYCDEDGVDESLPARCFAELASSDQLVVCTDIGFGSVNQAFLKEAACHPEVDALLFTGVNLPLLLELSVHAGPITRDAARMMVDQAREQMSVVDVPQFAHSGEASVPTAGFDSDFFD